MTATIHEHMTTDELLAATAMSKHQALNTPAAELQTLQDQLPALVGLGADAKKSAVNLNKLINEVKEYRSNYGF